MGENLQNYEVVLTETRYLCYYVEAESEQVAIDEVTTEWAEHIDNHHEESNGGIIESRDILNKVAYVMEQY